MSQTTSAWRLWSHPGLIAGRHAFDEEHRAACVIGTQRKNGLVGWRLIPPPGVQEAWKFHHDNRTFLLTFKHLKRPAMHAEPPAKGLKRGLHSVDVAMDRIAPLRVFNQRDGKAWFRIHRGGVAHARTNAMREPRADSTTPLYSSAAKINTATA